METHVLGRREETGESDAGATNSAEFAICSRRQGFIFCISNDGFGLEFGFWVAWVFFFFQLDLNSCN